MFLSILFSLKWYSLVSELDLFSETKIFSKKPSLITFIKMMQKF